MKGGNWPKSRRHPSLRKAKVPYIYAIATIYRFAYPQHYSYLLTQGMFVRWFPSWFMFQGMKDKIGLEHWSNE